MSLNKSATRRLSLLSGSSLVAATLSISALGGVVTAPSAALAQACTPPAAPSANGSAPDTYVCTGGAGAAGTYAAGIAYSSDGNLTVSTAPVAPSTNGNITLTANGVDLAGNGSDSVTWNSTAGTVTGGAGTAGPVIDVTSVSGAISISTVGVTATQAGTTNAIRAVSTGGGGITIARPTFGNISNNVAGATAAIQATTNGGNISITNSGGGSTEGRLRGIWAQTSGAGSVTISMGNVSASTVDGIAAIDVTAGTGGVNMTLTGGVTGGAGHAIRVVSGAGAIISNSTGNIGSSTSDTPTSGGSVDFSGVTTSVTFSNAGATSDAGRWRATGASLFSAGNDTLNMSGVGKNVVAPGASINFGAGADTFNNSAFLTLGEFSSTGASLDFGTGTDAFNMSGTLSTSGLTTISNLEAFNNSGTIYLGTGVNVTGTTIIWTETDGVANDVLRMTGGTFTGSGDGRIVADVLLATGAQEGCATLNGAADCLDLRGASSAGVTSIVVNDISTNGATQGAYVPGGITLVDVGGAGTSAAGHFVLDPDSDGYAIDRTFGAMVTRPGLFGYALMYDAANQRHALVGVPRSEAMEYAMLAGAAQSIWHMTAETVSDRQTDLRKGTEAGPVWVRATAEYTKRDLDTELATIGGTLSFDNGYKLYAGTIIGGMDLIAGSNADYDYALGGQIGYVASSFDLTASASSGRMTGATGGVYGSVWSDWFFLDGAVNVNGLALDYSNSGINAKTTTFLNSIGAHAEAGIRTQLTDASFAEPLVTLSYVRSSFEEISLDGGEIEPGDSKSMRGALGLRLGSTLAGESVSASYFIAGRAWYEFDGESGGILHNPGAGLEYADEFSGAFGEAEMGVNIYNSANSLSGFLTSGMKWKDGYSAVNLSFGVRMAW